MSKRRKRLVAGMAMVLVLLMVMSLLYAVIPAYAVTQSQIDALEDARGELESKSNELKTQIDSLSAEQARYIDRKAALDEQNELNRQEIELINEQIELYDQMIEEKAQQLEEAIATEKAQYELLRTRIRAMEENGSLSYLAILFQASSFTDLLSRIGDIGDIMSYDKELEEQYIAARHNVERLKAEYEETQREQEEHRTELLDKKAQLEEQIQAAYEMIEALEDDIDVYTKAFDENEAEEREVQKQIDTMVQQLKEQEAAAAAAAAAANQNQGGSNGGSTANAVGSGTFIWPTPSCYYVSSPYGYRVHPIFGTQRFHAGIDIGASAGASIVAAAGGTVSIATYSSSYGNYVMINHGGGNITLYAHMSSMAVSAGDTVNQGDVIGYVGSTGWSTGPHCHFEIRINNTLVDPMTYF